MPEHDEHQELQRHRARMQRMHDYFENTPRDQILSDLCLCGMYDDCPLPPEFQADIEDLDYGDQILYTREYYASLTEDARDAWADECRKHRTPEDNEDGYWELASPWVCYPEDAPAQSRSFSFALCAQLAIAA